MNMSGLAELLQAVRDDIFTVQFRAQPKVDSAVSALQAASKADFSDKTKLAKLAKEIAGG